MNRRELEYLVTLGEDSRRQFKEDVRNADSLAADMVAFSNSEGGVILIGVADDGSIPGLTLEDVRRVNQLIGNAATQHVRSPLSKVFEGALGFVLRSLPKQQQDRGVNEPGRPAIPRIVFEELLVNALIHRDYFVEAPVRLFVFEDRIEIVSPGHLPNHLTVEKIRAGNSVLRNPILASFAAKGVLPYRGLGTGIRRALTEWSAIDFRDDREACTFTATTKFIKVQNEPVSDHDKALNELEMRNKGASKAKRAPANALLSELQKQIIVLISADPKVSYDKMAEQLGKNRTTIMRNIGKMKNMGILVRRGSKKTGHWEVTEQGRLWDFESQ